MSPRVLRFLMVGGVTTAMNYVLLAGLVHAGLHHLAAATVGWAAGLIVSFVLNKRFTFEVRSRADLREVGSFVGGYLLQLLLGLSVYAVLIDGLRLPLPAAFLINLVVVAAFSFLFMRRAVFRPVPAAG